MAEYNENWGRWEARDGSVHTSQQEAVGRDLGRPMDGYGGANSGSAVEGFMKIHEQMHEAKIEERNRREAREDRFNEIGQDFKQFYSRKNFDLVMQVLPNAKRLFEAGEYESVLPLLELILFFLTSGGDGKSQMRAITKFRKQAYSIDADVIKQGVQEVFGDQKQRDKIADAMMERLAICYFKAGEKSLAAGDGKKAFSRLKAAVAYRYGGDKEELTALLNEALEKFVEKAAAEARAGNNDMLDTMRKIVFSASSIDTETSEMSQKNGEFATSQVTLHINGSDIEDLDTTPVGKAIWALSNEGNPHATFLLAENSGFYQGMSKREMRNDYLMMKRCRQLYSLAIAQGHPDKRMVRRKRREERRSFWQDSGSRWNSFASFMVGFGIGWLGFSSILLRNLEATGAASIALVVGLVVSWIVFSRMMIVKTYVAWAVMIVMMLAAAGGYYITVKGVMDGIKNGAKIENPLRQGR